MDAKETKQSRPTQIKRIEQLEQEVKRLQDTLSTALLWIGQSAGAPLSHKDVRELIAKLHPKEGHRT